MVKPFTFFTFERFQKKVRKFKVKMDSKKEQIIQAALKRFSYYGFHKTTMNEIAVDLNITKANLYYYYLDKNALIKDVLEFITSAVVEEEMVIVAKYQGNVREIAHQLLDLRARYMREYYILHINENLEWIKGQGIACLLQEIHLRDIEVIRILFNLAIESGELYLYDVEQSAVSFVEIVRGLSLLRSVDDILSGMPNSDKVDDILRSQKAAVDFILSNKLNNINKAG